MISVFRFFIILNAVSDGSLIYLGRCNGSLNIIILMFIIDNDYSVKLGSGLSFQYERLFSNHS